MASQHTVGGLLEVVPAGSEIINGCAKITPDVFPNSLPHWSISGIAEDQNLSGNLVDFVANDWVSELVWLYNQTPRAYTIVTENKICKIKVYSSHIGKVQIAAGKYPSLEAYWNAYKKIEDYFKNPIFEPKIEKPAGSFEFSNQFVERKNSYDVQYVWALSANAKTSIEGKIKFSTALAGIPPFLAEADLYILLKGQLAVIGAASRDKEGIFEVSGGANGTITVGVGGEANIAKGIIYVGIQAEASIKASGDLYGESVPPAVGMHVTLEGNPLTVVYKVSTFWGAWANTDSWQAFPSKKWFDEKIPLVPGLLTE